jgi:anhydro-N-acetylmuramic acid kinase
MAPAETRTEELARLHADLGQAFAAAAAEAIEAAPRHERPALIGLAGQTVCHYPGRHTVTLQLGEPARVAARTLLPVVAEFRQGDIAAGGEGAPLVPWTDWVLLRSPDENRAVQNIGGVGNVTWLPAGCGPEAVVAFDTGPGNMLIDALVAHITSGRQSMDRDGRRAARGIVLERLLVRWLEHPYFRKAPPKTTGRELFGQPFLTVELSRLQSAGSSPDDWVATATALTVRSIARACRTWLPGFPAPAADPHRSRRSRSTPSRVPIDSRRHPTTLIVTGGGARNPAIMSGLAAALPGVRVQPIASLGVKEQEKEAMSFAVLAAARADGIPANLPQVTGADRPAIMGAIVLP